MPIQIGKVLGKTGLARSGYPINVKGGNFGIRDVKFPFATAKEQFPSKPTTPWLNQALSVARSPQSSSRMRPWVRPTLGRFFSWNLRFIRKSKQIRKGWREFPDSELLHGAFSKLPRSPPTGDFLGDRLIFGN